MKSVAVSEPVIDPGSAAAALQKALSALGPSSAYTSSGYGSGYADPSELRAGSTIGPGGSGTDSFYEAYIIRPTVVERSTIDSRGCQGNQSNVFLFYLWKTCLILLICGCHNN